MPAQLKKKILFFIKKKKNRNLILWVFDNLEKYLYFLIFVFANNYHWCNYLLIFVFFNSLKKHLFRSPYILNFHISLCILKEKEHKIIYIKSL